MPLLARDAGRLLLPQRTVGRRARRPLSSPADTILESLVRAAHAPDCLRTRFMITDDGAVGDGRADHTKKIQAAVGDCSVKGGGIVVISGGTFISGSLFFKAKTALRIKKAPS